MDGMPPETVIRAFGVTEAPTPLAGGEGRSVLAGDLVLKPCDDPDEWAWLGRWLPIIEQDGFRLAPPVRAAAGGWVVDGWCAQVAVEGVHAERWSDVLRVGRRFAAATARLPRPAFIDRRTHPWSVGDRVAWGELAPPGTHPLLEQLMRLRRPIDLPSQVIHGDLTENVLFAEDVAPAVIDVTTYWRPVGYQLAIVVGDAIRWRGASPTDLLPECAGVERFEQLFVRAVIFRLVTTLVFALRDVTSFESVVEVARSIAG